MNTVVTQQWRLPRQVMAWACLALVLVHPDCPGAEQANQAPHPHRIASLGPSLTKQLYLLGVAQNVVGITTYCPQPSNLPAVERIGSVVDPNLEAIVRLRPDLVLATPLTNRKRVAALRALRMPVVEFPPARTFDEICEQFLELGKQVGREKEAMNIVREARAEAESIRKSTLVTTPPKVFIQIGVRPLCTAAKDSFLNDLIEMAGGINIAKQAKIRTYSREAVLAANPDCIIIVTMGLAGPDEKQKWRQYENLAAAENDRIYLIDSEKVCSPTPVSFVDALASLAGLLHPEVEVTPDAQP